MDRRITIACTGTQMWEQRKPTKRRSLVPRLAKDAVYYRSALEDLKYNIDMVQRDLACKDYAAAAWYPRLLRNLEK